MIWYYEINGVRHDNVTEDDITGLIVHGELTAATLVWRQGMTEWQPVSAPPTSFGATSERHTRAYAHSP